MYVCVDVCTCVCMCVYLCVCPAAYCAFVKHIYSIFLKSSLPTSYGAVTFSAHRGGAPSAVVTVYPPGCKLSMDALMHHGMMPLLMATLGPSGLVRFSQLGHAFAQRDQRITAAIGGVVGSRVGEDVGGCVPVRVCMSASHGIGVCRCVVVPFLLTTSSVLLHHHLPARVPVLLQSCAAGVPLQAVRTPWACLLQKTPSRLQRRWRLLSPCPGPPRRPSWPTTAAPLPLHLQSSTALLSWSRLRFTHRSYTCWCGRTTRERRRSRCAIAAQTPSAAILCAQIHRCCRVVCVSQ